ncbi:hypothetical protein ACFOZY_13320 [Chungangia koreensis]|uniref:Nicotinamide mononucleotide transporter n=1 Tax=Chungangia koreensis TaxID=752657 RepID=A0ABV8X7M1_9LACT
MTEYVRGELRVMNQVFLAFFLIANFAFSLYLSNNDFPWFALVGAPVGLAIIVYCWSETKYMFFNTALLVSTLVYTVVYNWGSIFSA